MASGTGIRLGARVSELSVFSIERSIVRRGFVLLALVLPGHVLNYAFGIFYAAISIINVLFAPSLILSLFLARHFARLKAHAGPGTAAQAFRQAFRLIARWGLLALFLGLAALSVIGSLVGVESFVLIALIVLITYTAYVTDVVRAAFQGLQLFVLLGLMGLAWMALRFAGLVGILVSGLVVCAIFYHVVLRRRDAKPSAEAAFPIEVRKLVQFALSFGIFSIIINLDVVVGYLVMERASFGVYAASSVLPKAIILLSLPVGQVLFPVLADEESVGRVRSTSAAKGLGFTFFVSGVGSVILLAFADVFCGEGSPFRPYRSACFASS
jgi:O-antigen/teichoic acid export membrane protein